MRELDFRVVAVFLPTVLEIVLARLFKLVDELADHRGLLLCAHLIIIVTLNLNSQPQSRSVYLIDGNPIRQL